MPTKDKSINGLASAKENIPLIEASVNQSTKVESVEGSTQSQAFFKARPGDPKEDDPSLQKLLAEEESCQNEKEEKAYDGLDANKNIEKCDVIDEESLRCGWGPWRPDFLQKLLNPKCFVIILSLFSMVQGLIVLGLTTVTIADIEKEFGLSSTDAGLIFASNDIAGILLVPIVAFLGQNRKKPKWVGFGALLTGIGSLLFAMPKAIIGKHVITETRTGGLFCNVNVNATASQCVENTSNTGYLFMLCLGQFIMGAGAAPLYTLGLTYLDENVNPKMSPIYLGGFLATTFLGPGAGIMIGGAFSEIYTDIKLPKGVQLTPRHQNWIGAWWMGFVALAWTLLLSGFVLLCFPREMPAFKKERNEALAKGDLKAPEKEVRKGIKGFIMATFHLVTNVTFIFAVLGETVKAFYGSATGSFMAKLILLKFGGSPLEVALAMTVVSLPGMGGAILLGSFIMKRFKLRTSAKTAALMCSFFCLMTCLAGTIFFLPGCNTTVLAGSTAPYQNRKLTNSLSSPCNRNCSCARHSYAPVCGIDGKTYFSPCYAGCQMAYGKMIYGNCKCISKHGQNKTMDNIKMKPMPFTNNSQHNHVNKSMKIEARFGKCDRKCKNLVFFMIGMFFLVSLGFVSGIPQQMILMRSVPDNQRAYALGVKSFIQRTLSFLPAPMVFGSIIDSQCILWKKDKCGNRGNCLDYKLEELSSSVFYLGLVVGVVAAACYLVSWYFFKPEEKTDGVVDKVGFNAESGVTINGEKGGHT